VLWNYDHVALVHGDGLPDYRKGRQGSPLVAEVRATIVTVQTKFTRSFVLRGDVTSLGNLTHRALVALFVAMAMVEAREYLGTT